MKKILISSLILSLLIISPVSAKDKKATLSNGKNKIVVVSGSKEAKYYFSLGYKLYSEHLLGSTIPVTPALYESSLASPIGTTDNSMTVVKGTDLAGNALNGYMCFTIDSGSPAVEYVCGTASSTSITSLLRGIDPITGTTSVAALKFSHRRGASIKVTDYPVLTILARMLNGQDSLPNGLTISSTSTINGISIGGGAITGINTPSIFSTTSAANVQFVNNQLASGVTASNASTTQGIQAFNGSPVTLGVKASSTGGIAIDAGGSVYVNASTTKGIGYGTDGRIYFNGLDINNTWTGTNTFNGTSTMTTTTFVNNFGGDGSDGALNLTTGTTTINLGGLSVVEKNYTSINISGTSSLAFSNPNASGSIIILKSKGDCTITSSANPAIDLRNMGVATSTLSNGYGFYNHTESGVSYTGLVTQFPSRGLYLATSTLSSIIPIAPGGAGAGGYNANSGANPGTNGGRGAGAMYIECGGSLNFTGAIKADGEAGGGAYGSFSSGVTYTGGGGASNTNGTASASLGNTTAYGSGGGGGAGMVWIVYRSLTANSGTITVTAGGGTGGTGLYNIIKKNNL